MSTNVKIGFVLAFASASLFAIRPIMVKLVYAEGVDPTTLIAVRMLISLPLYSLLLIWALRRAETRSRLSVKTVSLILLMGLFGYYAASLFDLLGLQYVTAQLGRLLLYTYPTFVVLLGALLFGNIITKKTVSSLILTFIGIGFIFGHDLTVLGEDVYKGAFFITLSSISFAIYLTFSKTHIDKVGPQLFTALALSGATLAVFVHFLLTRDIQSIELSQKAWYYIAFIAVFNTVVPAFFTAAAVARIGSGRTGIVATIGPAITSVAAVSILTEAFTVYHLIGIAFTLIGISLLSRTEEP